ncbi:MlaE family lipid ABC transporter permease subunit [Salipiger bermudensis]|uniref:ABC transporter permease n=1 Tax=Salipiger bermudensis TaxID=344736 RepID=UPI001C992A19|nr:MlaE family lipid ABC transporter permease subunit [Salipiger bermudensis]MBY6004096.1 MlaE family lipid ABC transporter permease subunit [Salipiger bermudensis]
MAEQGRIELDLSETATEAVLRLSGVLSVRTVSPLRDRLSALNFDRPLVVDLASVERIDTAGAWLLAELEARATANGASLALRNAGDTTMQLLDNVRQARPQREERPPAPRGVRALLDQTGRAVVGTAGYFADLTGFLGLFLARLARLLRHPSQFRLTALVAHCEDVGLRAVPIVALMSFLIGVVLAFQGSEQLRQFGAEVFVVDLIAISVLRELGILLTAIIVAGRTASAFTAAIGSMKMREEIDAMRTLGLDPAVMLFVPRILALLLMLPILGLIADFMGLFGGALMAWLELGISPSMFVTRLIEGTGVGHLFVGLVKAPAFALIIGVVGCHAGMQVKGNAESLGRMTSGAVVAAIFAVILADALFSVFFAKVGI